MVKQIKVYVATCDGCQSEFELSDGFMASHDPDEIIDELRDDPMWVMVEDKKTFCFGCHSKRLHGSSDQWQVWTKEKPNAPSRFLGLEMYH